MDTVFAAILGFVRRRRAPKSSTERFPVPADWPPDWAEEHKAYSDRLARELTRNLNRNVLEQQQADKAKPQT